MNIKLKYIKHLIDKKPTSSFQLSIIFICFLLNVIDGMDVLVISYTAPSIVSFWDISPETLGIVFSSGLFGMAIGALFLAPYADKLGRKKIILISSIIISLGVFLTAFSKNIIHLTFLRFLSGIGIGTMLASTVSLVSEYTSDRSKDFWISFVLAGYPVGAVLAGYLSNIILSKYSWQYVYIVFGSFSLLLIPVVYYFLFESLGFLIKSQPINAISRINRIFDKLKIANIKALPAYKKNNNQIAINELLNKKYMAPTLKLWIAFFSAFVCLYYLISWIPKLVTDMGLSMELGIYSGIIFNVGAFLGIITQGYLSSKFGLKRVVSTFMILTCVLMTLIRYFIDSDLMLFIFGVMGFTIQGGFVGLYAFAARIYPIEFRTTGIGWGIGLGRFGAVISPLIGGYLIGAGLSISQSFMFFGAIAFLSGFSVYITSTKD